MTTNPLAARIETGAAPEKSSQPWPWNNTG